MQHGVTEQYRKGDVTQDYNEVQERGRQHRITKQYRKGEVTQDYKKVQERSMQHKITEQYRKGIGNTRLQDSTGKGR